MVYLTAALQKARIAESLERAGIRVAQDILDTPYLLRVTLGAGKGNKRCGAYSNVRYALRVEGRSVIEFAEEGWTGTCFPNVFDDMSERLASEIGPPNGEGGDR